MLLRNAGAAIVALLALVASAEAYLPALAPIEYDHGARVPLKVNKLDSVRTQLPYEYYSLPFCRPPKITEENENLGEVLAGDRIETSLYHIQMKLTQACLILCRKPYSDKELAQFAERIEEEYRVNWIVDNLPAATKYYTAAPGTEGQPATGPEGEDDKRFVPHYEKGFELGFVGSQDMPLTTPGVKYINNHVRLVLYFHEDQTSFTGSRIVGFEVEPFSVLHKIDGEWKNSDTTLKTCTPLTHVVHGMTPQPVSGPMKASEKTILWTYDVKWEPSDIKWASRWDLYLHMTDSQIHWFSIVNSTMIVLFLTGMIAMIMMHTLHRDLLAYNSEDVSAEEQVEETGWKLLHGDVFRPPARGGLFSVLVGSGVQVTAMTTCTLSLAALGFLSPANRGMVMTALLLLFVFMGVVAGYYSTRTFKMFKLTEWKHNTFWTAVFFPGICFAIFFMLNLLVWGEKSSGAVPFGTLLALLVLWFGISVPLVYVGSYFAFKRPADQPPVSVNHIPRMVPEQAWYMRPHFSVMVGGVLPFGAVFIEIFFIMSSVWLHQFYYVFGFLFVVFLILIVTCAEITIVMCYFQLCGEDYHWWWRSFFTSGSSALYLFAYSALYFSKLEVVKLVPALLYFGYMALVSFAFFLMTGTIGYFACHWFVYKIYSSIKVD